VVETLLTNAVGSEVEYLQAHLLLSYTCTNIPYATVLEVVIAKIKQAQGMVGAKDAPKVLAILWTQVIAAQPQLLEVLIELHCSHYTEDRGNTPQS